MCHLLRFVNIATFLRPMVFEEMAEERVAAALVRKA